MHTAYVFSIRVCVMDIVAGGAEANAGRRRGRKVIDALVRKTKEWLGKCKIGMRRETARGRLGDGLAMGRKSIICSGQSPAQP